MYKAKVYVTLRESILDPAGAAVRGSLRKLGFEEVREARIGKYIELALDGAGGEAAARERVQAMCDRLLANPVMEDCRFEIEAIEEGARRQ